MRFNEHKAACGCADERARDRRPTRLSGLHRVTAFGDCIAATCPGANRERPARPQDGKPKRSTAIVRSPCSTDAHGRSVVLFACIQVSSLTSLAHSIVPSASMGGSPSNLSVGKEKPITIVTYIPGQALPPPGAAVPQPRAPGEPVNPYDPDGDGGLRASTLPRFTAQNTALHGTKTTVVPRALEQTPHLGVVQFIPQVVTPAERAEMRRLKEDRLNCRWDRYRTWQGQGHLIGGVAFGAFMSILTPSQSRGTPAQVDAAIDWERNGIVLTAVVVSPLQTNGTSSLVTLPCWPSVPSARRWIVGIAFATAPSSTRCRTGTSGMPSRPRSSRRRRRASRPSCGRRSRKSTRLIG